MLPNQEIFWLSVNKPAGLVRWKRTTRAEAQIPNAFPWWFSTDRALVLRDESALAERIHAATPRERDLLGTLRRVLTTLDAPDLEAAGGFAALGIEDLLLRLLALLLFPELLEGQAARPVLPAPLPREQAFHGLLEWMRVHLRSPMQWLKDQRFEAARQALLHPAADDTVATIARRHGFGDLSGFASGFQRRYGVLSSGVLRLARSQP